MTMRINGHDVEQPMGPRPIEPLPNDEAYEALTETQRADRYMAVIEHQIARATYFSKKVSLPRQYLSDQLVEFAESAGAMYGVSSHETKATEIDLARNIARFEPLVSTALDRLTSFSITPSTFEGIGDLDLEQVLNYWRDNLGALNDPGGYVKQGKGLKLFEEKFVRRLLVDGDVVPSETWESVSVPVVGRTKSGKRSVKIKSYMLPTRLSLHDLKGLKVNETSSLFNREVITMALPEDIKQLVNKTQLTREERDTLSQLPPHILRQVKQGLDEVSLTDPKSDESFVSHIKFHGEDFSPYGISFLNSCYEPVARKYRLRALDEATITGLINRLTIIKAGLISIESGKTTITPNRLRQLEQLISQPKTNELIIWPGDDIEVLDIGPSGKILEVQNRYDHIDNDILAALGIPRILIDGKSEISGERAVYASFLGVREIIDQDIRNNRLIPYIEGLLQRIAEKNNFKGEIPRYQMGRVNLADPELLLNQSKFQYDRGLQSERSAITDSGGRWDIEFDRRLFESEDGIVNNFGIPELAFNEPQDRDNSGPKDDTEKISDPDKPDDTGSNAARAFLEDFSYESNLQALYTTHTANIVKRLEDDDVPESTVKGALIVLFGLMKKQTASYMTDIYNSLVNDKDFDSDVLSKTILWSDEQFENWYSSVTAEISKIFNQTDDPTSRVSLVAGLFATALSTRLYKYRVAIPSKVERAAQVSNSVAAGQAFATWVTTFDEKTCQYCASLHGKSMEVGKVLEIYPVHPNCRCDYIEHTSLPEDSDTDIPEKDPDNWSNVR